MATHEKRPFGTESGSIGIDNEVGMRIFVLGARVEEFTLQAHPNDTIDKVKEKIPDESGLLAMTGYDLIWAMNQLKHGDRTLGDYNIVEGSKLVVRNPAKKIYLVEHNNKTEDGDDVLILYKGNVLEGMDDRGNRWWNGLQIGGDDADIRPGENTLGLFRDYFPVSEICNIKISVLTSPEDEPLILCNITPLDTVNDVKVKLLEKWVDPVPAYDFLYNGRILEYGDGTLHQYNIIDYKNRKYRHYDTDSYPTLPLVVQTRDSMQLFVKTLDGVILFLEAVPTAGKVYSIKKIIQDKTGILPGVQYLTLANRKHLEDQHLISEYYIRENSTISLGVICSPQKVPTLEVKLKESEDKIKEMTERLQMSEEAVLTKDKQMSELQKDHTDQGVTNMASVVEKLEQELKETKKSKNEAITKNQRASKTIEEKDNKISKLTMETGLAFEKLQLEIDTLNSDLKQKGDDLHKAKEEMTKLKATADRPQREKELSLLQQRNDMVNEIEMLKKEKFVMRQEMEEKIRHITEQLEHSNTAITQKNQVMSQLALKTNEKDQAYERIRQDEVALHSKLMGVKEMEFQTTQQQLTIELKALKTRIDHEMKRYKLLQKEKDMISQEMKDMAHRLKVDDLCDVMLSTAYIQHQWEELGRVLRVPSSELKRIASKDCSVTRSHHDVLRYWIARVGGSWKGLVDVLKHKDIGQKELADEISRDHSTVVQRHHRIHVKDHKLVEQYNDLLRYDVFSHVDWMVLGMVLGLDNDTLEQIETSHKTDSTRAQIMVDEWIKTGQSYWCLLVDALGSPIFGETELANRIAKDEMGIVDMQAGGVDSGYFTEGAYGINEDTVKEMKEEILKKLTNAASTLGSQPKGIIYAFAMTEVKGARVDLTTITNTFEKDLRFTVYPVEDISAAKLANLIKAAATVDYPRFCKHICFYFSGHGGIKNKRPFFKPKPDKDGGECFFIHDNVLVHFGKKKSRPKDKFIFFFDCCLSQSPDDKTPAEVGFFLEAPVRCLIAYATAVGVKAYGDTEKGGRWTSTLCEHLKEQVELGEALAKTHDVVMRLSNNKQPSHYRSCIGPVYLKGMPEKQASTTGEEESKNILRHHRSDLYETLHNDPTDLTSLATALSMDGIIDRALEDEVKRGQGKKEVVGKFLDKLEEKADNHPTCLPKLFDKMAHFDGTLHTVAQVLREEASNGSESEITTDIFEDLNQCKTENEILKQKLAIMERANKQFKGPSLKNDTSKWREDLTTLIQDFINRHSEKQ